MSSLLQKEESRFCPGFLKRRQVWVGGSAEACCLIRYLCGFINAGRMSRVGLLRWAQWVCRESMLGKEAIETAYR